MGEKLHDINTNARNMKDMVYNIHDICGAMAHYTGKS